MSIICHREHLGNKNALSSRSKFWWGKEKSIIIISMVSRPLMKMNNISTVKSSFPLDFIKKTLLYCFKIAYYLIAYLWNNWCFFLVLVFSFHWLVILLPQGTHFLLIKSLEILDRNIYKWDGDRLDTHRSLKNISWE